MRPKSAHDSFLSSSSVSQALLLRVSAAIQQQPIPERRASWRMRWVERFVNFIRQPESPASIAGCRERFLAKVATDAKTVSFCTQVSAEDR
jgi:hypothetical protein